MAKKNLRTAKRAISVIMTAGLLINSVSIPSAAAEKTGADEPEVTVTVTVEKDKLIDESTDTETGDKKGENAIVTGPETTESHTEWQETGREEGGWGNDEEKSEYGTFEITESEPETVVETKTAEITKNPLDEGDVTLNLRPDGKEVSTGENSGYYVSVEELARDNIAVPESEEYTDDDGNQVTVTVTPKLNADNVVIGYEVEEKTTIRKTTDSQIGEKYEGTTTAGGSRIIAPIGYTEGTDDPVDILDDNGNKIGESVTETRAIKDKDGNITGYEVTTTTVKTEVVTGEPEAVENVDSESSTETLELPERPEGSVSTDAVSGITTTVTVEDVKDGEGNIIGYQTSTVKTDKNGKAIESESHTVYGTKVTIKKTCDAENSRKTTTTVTRTELVSSAVVEAEEELRFVEEKTDKTDTVETTVITEKETYQLVETETGVYFVYKGQMWPVTAITEDPKEQHGDVTTESIQPDMSLKPEGGFNTVDDSNHMRNPGEFTVSEGIIDGYDFQFAGYGLESAIRVNYEGGYRAHQFVLRDAEGNEHYVLCADLDTDAIQGESYNMENVETADYYKRDGAAEHINTIALNGYWGTESGTGSLDSVKSMLRDQKLNGSPQIREILKDMTEADIDSLTDGEALTATQAAIWYYGNSNGETEKNLSADGSVTGWVQVSGDGYIHKSDISKETKNVDTLYRFLISLEPDAFEDPTTKFIAEDNFASGASIVIKEQATDENGNARKDEKGNDLYNGSISFTIEMKPSAISGDMLVTVRDEYGKELAIRRIAGEGTEKKAVQTADADGNAVYTLEDLQIAEGVKINLNLHGTQNLEQGVYLYTAEVYDKSQTFVGISKGEREVNLTVDMKFEVEKPDAKLERTQSSETAVKTDSIVSTKTDLRTDSRMKTTETFGSVEEIDRTSTVRVYADITTTEVKTSVTEEERDWSREWEKEDNDDNGSDSDDDNESDDGGYEDEKEDGGRGSDSTDDGIDGSTASESRGDDSAPGVQVLGYTSELPEEDRTGDRKLAVLPMTGDPSGFWGFLSAWSGLGFFGLTFAEKKRRKDK